MKVKSCDLLVAHVIQKYLNIYPLCTYINRFKRTRTDNHEFADFVWISLLSKNICYQRNCGLQKNSTPPSSTLPLGNKYKRTIHPELPALTFYGKQQIHFLVSKSKIHLIDRNQTISQTKTKLVPYTFCIVTI